VSLLSPRSARRRLSGSCAANCAASVPVSPQGPFVASRPRDGRRADREVRPGEGQSRSRSRASTSTTRRPASCAHPRSTTSPRGSPTRTTTLTCSSSVTPPSQAPTTHTRSSAAPCALTSASSLGDRELERLPLLPMPDLRQGRGDCDQPLRRRSHEGAPMAVSAIANAALTSGLVPEEGPERQ